MAEIIVDGIEKGENAHTVAMKIATAINDEWYNKEKDTMEVIIRR